MNQQDKVRWVVFISLYQYFLELKTHLKYIESHHSQQLPTVRCQNKSPSVCGQTLSTDSYELTGLVCNKHFWWVIRMVTGNKTVLVVGQQWMNRRMRGNFWMLALLKCHLFQFLINFIIEFIRLFGWTYQDMETFDNKIPPHCVVTWFWSLQETTVFVTTRWSYHISATARGLVQGFVEDSQSPVV